MAVVSDLTASWSSGTTLSADEVWQCHAGEVLVATGPTAPASDVDGIALFAPDSVKISSGKTVYYKLADTATAVLTRTEV